MHIQRIFSSKENLLPLLVYGLFLLTGIFSLFAWGDIGAFDFFHNMGKPFFNDFFSGLTKFAEEYVVVVALLLLAIYQSYKSAISLLCGLIAAGTITQVLKILVFFDWHRPVIVLWKSPILNPPEFEALNSGNSFPSGHTTAAFAVYAIMALFVFRKQIWKVVLMLAAVLISYSRVFLGQHFVEDILMGSIIGLGIGGVVYYYTIAFLGRYKKLNESFVSRW